MDEPEESARTLRDTPLVELIGQTLVDITGSDPDDPEDPFIELFFEDGTAVRMRVPDGIYIR